MASTAGVAEESKAAWWLRFNNGVPADDGDDEVGDEEEEAEGAASATDDGGNAEKAVSGGSAACGEDAEVGMGPGDGRPAGVEAEMVVRGGGKAETEAAGAGGRKRSWPRFADRAPDEEISGGGTYVQRGELPRRQRKVIAKRHRLKVDGAKVQKDISQAQSPHLMLKGPEWVYVENEKLRLQLALKTAELKDEENRRLKLELILSAKEAESLQKHIEELKAENEQLRKNAKPPRVPRLCRSCNAHVMHDYRNCPKRRRAASSPEEDGEDSY